jgi:hypothetical protein
VASINRSQKPDVPTDPFDVILQLTEVQRQLSQLPSDAYEQRMQLRDRERELRTIARTSGTTSNYGLAASDDTPNRPMDKGNGCLLAFLIGILIIFAILYVLFSKYSMWVSNCGPGGCF